MAFGVSIPLLDTMTAGIRFAYPFIESLSYSNLSANNILKHLADNGMGVRRTEGLSLIRFLRDQQAKNDYISGVRLDLNPNPDRFGLSVTNTLRQYSYKVRVDGLDSVTGEGMTQWVTVSTDTVLTKSAAIDIATGYIEGQANQYNINPSGYTVTAVTTNPNYL